MGNMKNDLELFGRGCHHKPPEELNTAELHDALAHTVMLRIDKAWARSRQKHALHRRGYYFSAEFLVGRAIYNNLLCSGLYTDAARMLEVIGQPLQQFEEIEDAALGNGGLGRLAACFLDSAATLGLPLDGYGIRYRYGIFRQKFVNGFQREQPDDWIHAGDPWSVRCEEDRVTVPFADGAVVAVPYDMPIIGYEARHIATLRLWQCEPTVPFDFAAFNDQHYDKAVAAKNRAEDVCRVLYPNDSTPAGRLLRLKQQYFFCSASLQDMLAHYEQVHGPDWNGLPDMVTVQLNDTHPAIAIPELIRLLSERGVAFAQALDIVRRVFNYTNHTVMPEALEKWDMATVRRVNPTVATILRRLATRQTAELRRMGVPESAWPRMLLLQGNTVHMAYLACWCSSHINGVAQLHTDILKERVLADWHQWYPDKIQNKTNGVTQRRFLALCNPALCSLLTEKLGDDGFITVLSRLRVLESYANDRETMQRFIAIKRHNKERLSVYMQQHGDPPIRADALLDVQIKRLHEYKRQLLNILCLLEMYFEIREGTLTDLVPATYLFGAKAAPGYFRAKAIIKLIHEVAALIARDEQTAALMQVVFVTDYNVSYAEQIVAAADVSVQISTAGTEASGTGNMKLMINGAVTMGTYDGANIEIVQEAGEENNFIFGARVEDLPQPDEYCPRDLYENDPRIRRCLDALVDGTLDDGDTGMFRELYTALLDGADWHAPDHYYVLGDFDSCLQTRLRINREYAADPIGFAGKQWRNLCAGGKFSSDRTVREYAQDIWNIR